MLHDHDDHVAIAVRPDGHPALCVQQDPVAGLVDGVGEGAPVREIATS